MLHRFYVADAGNNCVVSFIADAANGTAPSATAAVLTTGSPTSPSLDTPLNVAFAPDQSIWVTDTQRGGLVQFNVSSGAVSRSWAGQQVRLRNSQTIAVDSAGMLDISDWAVAAVRKVGTHCQCSRGYTLQRET